MIDRRRKSNGVRVAIAALGFLAVVVTGCATKTAQTAPNFTVPVTVAKVVQKTVPIELTAIGSADAYSNVSIKAQVNAVLEQVHIKEGQFVEKGDLLFTLDARPFEAALAQAQANLARDKAQAELNDVQAKRYGELYKAGVAPKNSSIRCRPMPTRSRQPCEPMKPPSSPLACN